MIRPVGQNVGIANLCNEHSIETARDFSSQ
jgi:hypothetical protein